MVLIVQMKGIILTLILLMMLRFCSGVYHLEYIQEKY